jgi:peptidoglycan hydrolase-like protein with peptidoglycan-binding domain
VTAARGRTLAGLILLAVAGGVAVVLLGAFRSDGAAAPVATHTGAVATVARRSMTSSIVLNGTYGSAAPVTIAHRTDDGTATLTALPAVGTVVRRGDTLYRADQHPVVLFYGRVPMYRTLIRGMSGLDVREVQENLVALGALLGVPDGHYGLATKLAVKAWQRQLGLKATGRVVLGSVVVAGGPRRVAPGGAALGAVLSDGTPVCALTSVSRRVRVPLTGANRSYAHAGAKVDVTLPSQSTVSGRVRTVAQAVPDAQASGDGAAADGAKAAASGGSAGSGTDAGPAYVAAIALRPSHRVRALPEGSQVSIKLSRELRHDVLTVPVTALVARPGGGYGLRVVRGAVTTETAVTVGVFANGLAEVRGPIHDGDRVAIPSGP